MFSNFVDKVPNKNGREAKVGVREALRLQASVAAERPCDVINAGPVLGQVNENSGAIRDGLPPHNFTSPHSLLNYCA